ncbi:helix-turn-helix domain-containing protein [Paratissierella segnis]|jgi:transcriptional regulator with XRE-family HTH domain|uniref:Helix-turn-helix transcriptional regulator n=1 Tax=Paratissierella segnis TaxID=2763679 RepID=A0A926EWP4_9FIRM|nr:helix-turn-helix transcriptional regulator [Paratissierella segnis]MBC8588917.1 helix-turn-helix transcriptional regulator [Paratissierella segnis]
MKRLKELREEKNITQVRMGIELGVSQETISGYEIGKAMPPADMLVKLADILDTSVDYILGRTDNRYFNKLNKSDLSEQELELLLNFRKLPQNKKERLIGFLIGIKE